MWIKRFGARLRREANVFPWEEAAVRMLADALMLNAAMLLAFATWFFFYLTIEAGTYSVASLNNAFRLFYRVYWPFWTLVGLAVFVCSGFYTRTRGYDPERKMAAVFRAVSITAMLFVVADYLVVRGDLLPRGVTVLAWFWMMLFIGGSRWVKEQLVTSYRLKPRYAPSRMVKVLMFGGNAPIKISREVRHVAPIVPAGASLEIHRANRQKMGLKKTPCPVEKTILITGGAGFIGASLAERLCEQSRVILFDRTFDNMPFQYSAAKDHPNVECVTGDVLNYDHIAAQTKRVNMIVHLAAIVGVQQVRENARATINVNFIGTSNALRAAEANKKIERFVYFSTSEIFGVNSFRVREDMSASIGPVDESRWSYAIAKLAGEHLVNAYFEEAALPTVIVRPFNVFGPKRLGDHALSRFIFNALEGRDLEVHGDGSQIRSWCYIDDFCDGVIRTLSMGTAVGQDFNIGSARNTLTIYDLARRVIAITGSSSQIKLVEHGFSDVDVRVPRVDKARELLGYVPRYEMDDALRETIEWYRWLLESRQQTAAAGVGR